MAISAAFLGEMVGLWFIISLLLVLAGVYATYAVTPQRSIIGVASAILCALAWGAYIALTKVAVVEASPGAVMLYRTAFLALVLLPIAMRSGGEFAPLAVTYLAIGGYFGTVSQRVTWKA